VYIPEYAKEIQKLREGGREDEAPIVDEAELVDSDEEMEKIEENYNEEIKAEIEGVKLTKEKAKTEEKPKKKLTKEQLKQNDERKLKESMMSSNKFHQYIKKRKSEERFKSIKSKLVRKAENIYKENEANKKKKFE
jgi:hypothetical protein